MFTVACLQLVTVFTAVVNLSFKKKVDGCVQFRKQFAVIFRQAAGKKDMEAVDTNKSSRQDGMCLFDSV